MNLSDILILLAVAVLVVSAVLRIRRDKKTGKCCCGTSTCCGRCESCSLPCSKKPG